MSVSVPHGNVGLTKCRPAAKARSETGMKSRDAVRSMASVMNDVEASMYNGESEVALACHMPREPPCIFSCALAQESFVRERTRAKAGMFADRQRGAANDSETQRGRGARGG